MSTFGNMMGGGVGKSVDSVASSIQKIESSLRSIDGLLSSIGKKSDNLGDASSKAASAGSGKKSSSKKNQGGGKSTGVGAASFGDLPSWDSHGGVGTGSFSSPSKLSTGGTYTGPMPSFGTSSATEGLQKREDQSESLVGRFGGKKGIAASIGAGVASTVWTGLPGLNETLNQRQSMFRATIDTQGMPNYTGLKSSMMSAFGGYASSSSSQENVASLAKSYGMNVGTASFNRFAGSVSSISLLTGQSQEQAAAMQQRMGSAQMSNSLMSIGVRSLNKDGTARDMSSVVNDVIKQSFGGRQPTKKELDRELQGDGYVRATLEKQFGPDADAAIEMAQAQAANGGKQLSTDQLKKQGLLDGKRNPNAKQQEYEGAHSQTVSDYSDKMIGGWEKAIDAAKEVEKVLQDLKGVLGPLATAKGFGQGMTTTHAGNALLNGVEATAGGLGVAAGGNFLGRIIRGGSGGAKGLFNAAKNANNLRKLGKFGKAAEDVAEDAGKLGRFGSIGSKLSGAGRGLLGRLGIGGAEAAAEGGTEAAATAAEGAAASGGAAAGGGVAAAAAPAAAGVALQHVEVKENNFVGQHLGANENSSAGRKIVSTLMHFGEQAVSGNGGEAASGILHHGWNYGNKSQYHDTSVAGKAVGILKGIFGGHGAAAGSAGGVAISTGSSSGPSRSTSTSAKAGAKSGATDNAAVQKAVRFALAQKQWHVGWCDNFVANCWGHSASGFESAWTHWNAVPSKLHHTDKNPPAGALVFWKGSGQYGHITFSLGGGKVRSTDWNGSSYSPGSVGTATIDQISNRMMRNARYLGWTPPFYNGKVQAQLSGGGSYGGGSDSTPDSLSADDSATKTTAAAGSTASSAGDVNDHAFADENGSISAPEYSISSKASSTTLGRLGKRGSSAKTQSDAGKPASTGQGDSKATDSQKNAGSAPSVGGGSGVERWRSTIVAALKANGLPTSDNYVNAWLRQVNSESSGRESVTQQIHDVNSGGNEAQGLLQVIPPTFKSYMFPGHDNINKGYDNALAAINYAKHVYGKKMLAVIGHGHGYSKGSYNISEDQVADLHQGEMIVPAGMATEVRRAMAEVVAGQGASRGAGSRGKAAKAGSGGNIEIKLIANGELHYDSRQLAREVQRILNDEAEMALIGKS